MALEHTVRQAILRAMKELAGAPVTKAELLELSQEPAVKHYPAEAASQFDALVAMGYLEAVSGFGGKYFRIGHAGLEQLAPELPQNPFIWGPGAVS